MKEFLKSLLPNKYIKIFSKIVPMSFRVIKHHENKKIKDINNGKRCFILGNGPSLKNIDCELLKDEDIFTVNQINRSPIFNDIKPKYHFIADDDFFFLDPKKKGEAERLKYMISLLKSKDIKFVFPEWSKDFFDDLGFVENISYFSLYPRKNKINVDFVRGISNYYTVVQLAIYFAIYSGYSEIYLLGVDNTNYSSLLNHIESQELVETHVYKYSDLEKKEIISKKNIITNTFIFENFFNLFKTYDRINSYCKEKNIKILNLSEQGILDVFKLSTLSEVVNGD